MDEWSVKLYGGRKIRPNNFRNILRMCCEMDLIREEKDKGEGERKIFITNNLHVYSKARSSHIVYFFYETRQDETRKDYRIFLLS
ncbi:MAG: hypothetical protein ACI8RA_002191 [Chlamydiales bacterium]